MTDVYNVYLYNLTTVLFGVASVNYLASLYAKKEAIARIGTPKADRERARCATSLRARMGAPDGKHYGEDSTRRLAESESAWLEWAQ